MGETSYWTLDFTASEKHSRGKRVSVKCEGMIGHRLLNVIMGNKDVTVFVWESKSKSHYVLLKSF